MTALHNDKKVYMRKGTPYPLICTYIYQQSPEMHKELIKSKELSNSAAIIEDF